MPHYSQILTDKLIFHIDDDVNKISSYTAYTESGMYFFTDTIDNTDQSLISYSNNTIKYNTDVIALINKYGIDFLGNKITSHYIPKNSNDLTNKFYVDSISTGLSIIESAYLSTIENININNELYNENIINGIELVTGMRILVWKQENKTENGIYIVSNNIETPAARSNDFDEPMEIKGGTHVYIEYGDIHSVTSFVVITPINEIGTIGTDDIIWTQFSSTSKKYFTSGLTVSDDGFTVQIDGTYLAAAAVAADAIVASKAAADDLAVAAAAIAGDLVVAATAVAGDAGVTAAFAVADSVVIGKYIASDIIVLDKATAGYIDADLVVAATAVAGDAGVTAAFAVADSVVIGKYIASDIIVLDKATAGYIAADLVVAATAVAGDLVVAATAVAGDAGVTAAFAVADSVVIGKYIAADIVVSATAAAGYIAADAVVTASFVAADTTIKNSINMNNINSNKIIFSNTNGTKFISDTNTCTYDGVGGITVASITTSSDERNKINIKDIESSLIHQLRPIEYNWKNPNMDQRLKFGFIAQEVNNIIPSIVNKTNETFGIEYINIIALLVKEVQLIRKQIGNI
jgi:hypothetical protein